MSDYSGDPLVPLEMGGVRALREYSTGRYTHLQQRYRCNRRSGLLTLDPRPPGARELDRDP